MAVWLSPFLVVVWVFEPLRLNNKALLESMGVAGVFGMLRSHILRKEEDSKIHGTAWYLLGVCITLVVYPADVSVTAICYLAWCDPCASMFGRLLGDMSGRLSSGKSYAGTVACIISAFAVTWGLFANAFAKDAPVDKLLVLSLVMGFTVGAVELVASHIANDNLLIPVSTGAVLYATRLAIIDH